MKNIINIKKYILKHNLIIHIILDIKQSVFK